MIRWAWPAGEEVEEEEAWPKWRRMKGRGPGDCD